MQVAFVVISLFLVGHFCNGAVTENPKIVIIGAGPSGIAAASKLFENGFTNVTILEAEDRIGGRVYTTKFGDYVVDLGGQWVHGVKGNVAYELASPLGLLEEPLNKYHDGFDIKCVDSQGNYLSEEVMTSYQNFYDKYAEGAWFGSDSNYESQGQYIETMFNETFKNNSDMMKDKKKYLHMMELSIQGMDPDESWFNVSTVGLFKECEGAQLTHWKERGYSTVLDVLMKRYPRNENELPVLNNTVLNSEVKSIDYSKKDEQISITTANRQMYKADHVIVTVSLGVLKENHDSLFIPKLPEEKVKAIMKSGFGNVGKVFLLFDKPFWGNENSNHFYYEFFWNEEDRKAIEADPEKIWVLGITGAFNVEHKPNLLELWLSGKYARLMENLPEERVFDHAVENLHRFLDKKLNVTKPIAMLRTKWHSNPHFRGTYSYRSVETQKNGINSEDLEGPITPEDLKILFAGEATSKYRYGTVDGAIATGWKAAERLTNLYKDKLHS